MPEVYLQVKHYVETHHIPAREIVHAPAGSTHDYNRALGCRFEQQAKCLFLKVSSGGTHEFVVCTLPAHKRADLKAIARVLDAQRVRMGGREELKATTGCNFGELPPMASIFGLKLVMDEDLLTEEEIYLNAGRLDVSLVVSPLDIQRVEAPYMITMD